MIERQSSGHGIKKNVSSAIPRYIVAVDTETLPEPTDPTGRILSHSLRLGCCISARMVGVDPCGEKTFHFRTTGEFWERIFPLTSPRHTVWLVAHNALFDFIVLGGPEKMEHGELTIDKPRAKRRKNGDGDSETNQNGYAIIDSPPTIIGCRVSETQGRLVIVDTLNWFRCPLSQLGSAIGRPKMPMPPFAAGDDIWREYCENDARIVFDTFVKLIQFVREKRFGLFRYTAPGQAMAAFRHRFMGHRILSHDNERIKSLERASYFGGRTEVFKLGEIKEHVFQLDISALFPSVMLGNMYPLLLDRFEFRPEYIELRPDCDFQECIAEVKLSTDRAIYPERGDKVTLYPTGEFTTILAGPELYHASLSGHIVSIRSWARYRTAALFTNFVNELWKMRTDYEKSGNKTYAEFVKALMNSLYGKFGQRSPKWEVDPDEPVLQPWSKWCRVNFATGDTTYFRSFGWQCQRGGGDKETPGNFPAIASFVCSYSRLRMDCMREIAEKSNVYYQGVDSLIVNRAGMDNLSRLGMIRERELGYLRVCGEYDTGTIRGNMDYSLGDKNVVAGRIAGGTENELGVYSQKRFSTVDRLFSGQSIDTIEETTAEWKRSAGYSKGAIGPGGWIIPPHYQPTPAYASVAGSAEEISRAAVASTNA